MLLVFAFVLVLIRDRVLLWDLGWPGTGDPFALASAAAVILVFVTQVRHNSSPESFTRGRSLKTNKKRCRDDCSSPESRRWTVHQGPREKASPSWP